MIKFSTAYLALLRADIYESEWKPTTEHLLNLRHHLEMCLGLFQDVSSPKLLITVLVGQEAGWVL
jgi:hypothetical protein